MIKENAPFSYRELDGDTLVVELAGEIDHHGAVRARGDIDELVFEKRPKKLVLDLSKVSFMDSSGLGLIMGRYSLMKEMGGRLILRSPTPAVLRILELVGMERMLRIENDKKEENEQ